MRRSSVGPWHGDHLITRTESFLATDSQGALEAFDGIYHKSIAQMRAQECYKSDQQASCPVMLVKFRLSGHVYFMVKPAEWLTARSLICTHNQKSLFTLISTSVALSFEII